MGQPYKQYVGPIGVARVDDVQPLLAATLVGQPFSLEELLSKIQVGLLVDPPRDADEAGPAAQTGGMSADFEQHQRRSGVTVAVQLGHLPFLMLQAQPEQIAVKGERPVEVSNLDGHGVDPGRRERPATYPFFPFRKPAPGSVAPEPQPISIDVHPGSYS